MTLLELKTSILTHKILNNLIIFVCPENTFLAEQYINAISKEQKLSKISISCLFETKNSALSLVVDYSETLNILRLDTFNEANQDYSQFTNTIVICHTVDPKLKQVLEPYIINIPKLLDWQVKDYIKTNCVGLTDNDADWLYINTNKNIFRIDAEVSKIALFAQEDQHNVFNALKNAPNNDLYAYNLFDIQKALLTKNVGLISDFMSHLDIINIDPVAFANMLLTQVKKILYVNFKSGLTVDQIGVSSGSAYYIQKDFKYITEDQIKKLIKFLASLDIKLKSNLLDMSKEQLIDYIICHIFAI